MKKKDVRFHSDRSMPPEKPVVQVDKAADTEQALAVNTAGPEGSESDGDVERVGAMTDEDLLQQLQELDTIKPRYLAKLNYLRALIIEADSADHATEIANDQMASWLASKLGIDGTVRVTPYLEDSYLVVKHAVIEQANDADSLEQAEAIAADQLVKMVPADERKHWSLTVGRR